MSQTFSLCAHGTRYYPQKPPNGPHQRDNHLYYVDGRCLGGTGGLHTMYIPCSSTWGKPHTKTAPAKASPPPPRQDPSFPASVTSCIHAVSTFSHPSFSFSLFTPSFCSDNRHVRSRSARLLRRWSFANICLRPIFERYYCCCCCSSIHYRDLNPHFCFVLSASLIPPINQSNDSTMMRILYSAVAVATFISQAFAGISELYVS